MWRALAFLSVVTFNNRTIESNNAQREPLAINSVHFYTRHQHALVLFPLEGLLPAGVTSPAHYNNL
jgi:hypothetical protein